MFRFRPHHALILAASLTITCLRVDAQQSMRFGLMVGPSVNWLNADANDWTSETRTRWSYGLMADFFMTDRYALSSGMTIASRQAHLDISDTVGEYTLGSVDIPLVLKMQTQQFDRMTYFAKFGGGIGFRTREKVELVPDRMEEQHLENYFTPIQTQFIIGLGAEYEIDGSSAIVLGADFTMGLNDALKDDDPRISKRDNFRFYGVQFTLGFFF